MTNKLTPQNDAETPSELREDLNSYSRTLENLLAGAVARGGFTPGQIAGHFGRRTIKVLEGFTGGGPDTTDRTPTPPFPLIVKPQPSQAAIELTASDLIDEDVVVQFTPGADDRPTPNIFEFSTPNIAEDADYEKLIALAVPDPDLRILNGALPVYVDSDHELADRGVPVGGFNGQKVIFRYAPRGGNSTD